MHGQNRKRIIVIAILAVAATTVFAAPQVYYVNDVTSLTNVLANLPDVTDDTYNGSRIDSESATKRYVA